MNCLLFYLCSYVNSINQHVHIPQLYDKPHFFNNTNLFNGSFVVHDDYIKGALYYLDNIRSQYNFEINELHYVQKALWHNTLPIFFDKCTTYDGFSTTNTYTIVTNSINQTNTIDTSKGYDFLFVTPVWLASTYDNRIKNILSLYASQFIETHDDLQFFITWIQKDESFVPQKDLKNTDTVLKMTNTLQPSSLCSKMSDP